MNAQKQKIEENQVWESFLYDGGVRLIIHRVFPEQDVIEAYSCDVNSFHGGEIRIYFLSTFHDYYKLVKE